MSSALDELCINTIRTLSIDAVQRANSGHPGLPMGAAVLAYAVWDRFLRHNPANPRWINRDRFVLSAGHGSMLLYSLLHLTGYDVTIEDLRAFRQWGSKTPGHPESTQTPGVEATTGPLGQGVGMMVGMAIAREMLAARFHSDERELFTFRVFGLCSDGDLMEGVSGEAASLAGHLGLGSIILLYDQNGVTIDGRTEITFTEDVGARFEAYGWHVQHADGMDLDAVSRAVAAAIEERERPSLILCRTIIGYGSPHKADSPAAHGAPLGETEVRETKRALGWPEESSFHVPEEVLRHCRAALVRGAKWEAEWNAALERARASDDRFRRQWDEFWRNEKTPNWSSHLPKRYPRGEMVATRKASGCVMNAVAPVMPQLVAGSADLADSNLTYLKNGGDFQKTNRGGRNLRFGIREHAMGAILNGIALTAPFRPVGSTFLCFLDYMKAAVRISALSRLPVIYVFSHDSIGVGEDGPTHQPVEQLWSLRTTPGLFVFRPADANETVECWKLALLRHDGPSVLVLTRQDVPVITPGPSGAMAVERGAYVLCEASRTPADALLLATGSEVAPALQARELLESDGLAVRVISMPCLELFDAQPADYQRAVLPPAVENRVAVEAGATSGWWKYVGLKGDVVGLDRFGASAPGPVLMEKFGFTAEEIARRVRAVVKRNLQVANEVPR